MLLFVVVVVMLLMRLIRLMFVPLIVIVLVIVLMRSPMRLIEIVIVLTLMIMGMHLILCMILCLLLLLLPRLDALELLVELRRVEPPVDVQRGAVGRQYRVPRAALRLEPLHELSVGLLPVDHSLALPLLDDQDKVHRRLHIEEETLRRVREPHVPPRREAGPRAPCFSR